jgi:predicted ArsR family transcriptional regulator
MAEPWYAVEHITAVFLFPPRTIATGGAVWEGSMALSAYQDRASPAWQIIEYIKRSGSATIKDLEELLGVTTNAVRQHLGALQADGYVERQRIHAGVGRPPHIYLITAKAHELFACHCDDLALTLLEEVFALEGQNRTTLLLDRVGSRLAQKYANSVRSELLLERVEQMAGALNRQGVLTDVAVGDENTIVLHTYNCPYHELAQEHREICVMDEGLMRKVLGSEVSLGDCVMDGHHSCTFVVRNTVAGNA